MASSACEIVFRRFENDELDVDFRLKLRVPHTQDRLKFLLESDTEARETEAAARQR